MICIHVLIYMFNLSGYETVAVGDLEDLVSDDCSDTGNIDEESIETMRAQAAAEAADAVAEEDGILAESPERYKSRDNFVALTVFSHFQNITSYFKIS